MVQQFDVIVIGAGPAGATFALTLKNSGLKIALIDKAVFPRDKICGDAVSSVAKRILRQIDPNYEAQLLEFAPKTYITKAKLYSPNFESLEIGFSKVGHCIRRVDFDNWLFNLAMQNKDVTFYGNVKIKTLHTNEEKTVVALEDGQVLSAKVVIGCDGAHSLVAKQLAGFRVNRNHYSGAVKQYYKNVKGLHSDSLEVYFLTGHLPGYFWIFPLSNNEANVGFGMLSATIADKKIDLKISLKEIIKELPEIWDRFKDAEALEEIKGFGLPLGSKKYCISGHRYLLCGDAASLIDPFSGEGIETAMESGKYAAELVMKNRPSDAFKASDLKAYDKRVYKKMWGNFQSHYYLQKLLGDRVWLINLLIKIGNVPWINKRITKAFY